MIENDKKIMRGEFRGDFTRDTFDPMKAFSRVLMQQGRVQLDADWNEHVSIKLHYMRNMVCDIGGPHWGPNEGAGFKIGQIENKEGEEGEDSQESKEDNDFCISAGHYYVKGILCELEEEISYQCQPNYPCPSGLLEDKTYLVYLDVWERHISYVEDDDIREVALGGPDTASRAKVICQVKVIENSAENPECLTTDSSYSVFLDFLESRNAISPGTGKMRAKVIDKPKNDKDPCLVAPESRYRGAENQLYRVEIHKSGNATDATFKWSRENGSVIFPVNKIAGDSISLAHLGRDCRYGLKPDDWVEIIDDDRVLRGEPGCLVQIIAVDREELTVTIKLPGGIDPSSLPKYAEDGYQKKHVLLRRWDQKEGSGNGDLPVPEAGVESRTNESWIDLEAGIQIQFPFPSPAEGEGNPFYQTGDYWLIPARTEIGDIEWPKNETDKPKAMLPHGVIHRYAPLAIIAVNVCGEIQVQDDLRRKLIKIWENMG